MFRITRVSSCRLAVLTSLFLATASVMAASTAPAPDLGKSWPNAADVSASPRWHVYVFHRDHVEYVQINDVNGTVRAAFATANGQTLVLPMGVDNASVSASQPSSVQTTTHGSELVYRDTQVVVMLASQPNGITWTVQTVPAVRSMSASNSGTSTSTECTTRNGCGGDLMLKAATTPITADDECTSRNGCGGDLK